MPFEWIKCMQHHLDWLRNIYGIHKLKVLQNHIEIVIRQEVAVDGATKRVVGVVNGVVEGKTERLEEFNTQTVSAVDLDANGLAGDVLLDEVKNEEEGVLADVLEDIAIHTKRYTSSWIEEEIM